MSAPQNNMLSFTPGTIIQSASVNQNFNDIVQLGGNSVGSQLQTLLSNNFTGFVQSGGILTTASGLTVNMTAAYIVVAGITYYMPAQSFTVTGSKDTYIDFVPGSVPVYQATAVANNANSPALYATNAVRMAIVVSGASTITVNNQGSRYVTAPAVGSSYLAVSDSNGVLIYPTNQNGLGVVGLRGLSADLTGLNAVSSTQLTGLSVPVIVPAGRKVKLTIMGRDFISSGGAVYLHIEIWRGTVGSGTKVASVQPYAPGASQSVNPTCVGLDDGVSGLQTYNAAYYVSANSVSTESDSTNTRITLMVELE